MKMWFFENDRFLRKKKKKVSLENFKFQGIKKVLKKKLIEKS